MKTKTQELQLIPAELNTALKDTKIEHSKAEQHALAFAPSMQEYLTYAEIIKGLNRDNPTDIDAKRARETRLKLVKVRTNAESIKDLRKEGIRAEGDLIQALFNVVKNSCIVTETEFTEIEKHQERLEEKRQAELSAKRIELLAVFGTDTTYLPLGVMTDEQFNRLLENETLAFNARKEQAEKAEAARIEAERLQAERIEAERLEAIRIKEELARIEKEKQDALNAAKERAESFVDRLIKNGFTEDQSGEAWNKYGSWNITWSKLLYFTEDEFLTEVKNIENWNVERVAKEAEEKRHAKQLAAEREAAAKEAKRLADIAEKQRKENEAKLKTEREAREKVEAELKAKKEAEEMEQQKERERIESEQADKLAKEKAALLAPDKEKIKVLFEAIKAIQIPECGTEEGKAIALFTANALTDLKKEIINLSQKLK